MTLWYAQIVWVFFVETWLKEGKNNKGNFFSKKGGDDSLNKYSSHFAIILVKIS